MRYAIFSDIHNNSQALSAVLLDASRQNVDAFLCLGDIGTDPSVQLVQSVQAETVFGNWELSGWRHLSPQLQPWALNLVPMKKFSHFWLSHAAPVWPESIKTLKQFLKQRNSLGIHRFFPYYTSESDALWQAFTELLGAEVPVLFHGHTHQQVSWVLGAENRVTKQLATSLTIKAGYTYIIGVGSVGLPRDSSKPSYVIFDSSQMRLNFIRVGQ